MMLSSPLHRQGSPSDTPAQCSHFVNYASENAKSKSPPSDYIEYLVANRTR